MDIFSVLTLFGGLAFFLYGMNVLSSGLERTAGGKLERLLKKMTANPFKSLLFGAGITIAIQSSSAVTVMLVGLVNSGIMELSQTVGMIMGSNIGTTLTTWLFATVGIKTDNVWLRLAKPENFSLILALAGAVLLTVCKSQKKKDVGTIFLGFSVLMFGMKLMSDAVAPLADMPEFAKLMTAFNNPLAAVLVGAVFTGIIQSSAASVGVLQALALTGNITYSMAIPIIMGQNIGTCVTALLSGIGVSRNAKKVAAVHVSFNALGTVICLTAFYALDGIFHFSFTSLPIGAMGISVVHTLFNLATTLVLFPFTKQLVKIANAVLPERGGKTETDELIIDERLLDTPSVAINECNEYTYRMAQIAQNTLCASLGSVFSYNGNDASLIMKNEDSLDKYEDRLGTALVKLSSKPLSEDDTRRVSKMLHVIGDFERLGDHAVNILKVSKEINDKKITFSPDAKRELSVLTDALGEILSTTVTAYTENSPEKAKLVEPLEQVIDGLVSAIKDRHIKRLQNGGCTIEMGFILSDLLNNCERVSDHCSNIAVSVIEINRDAFDTHRYLNSVKYGSSEFCEVFDEYKLKYSI